MSTKIITVATTPPAVSTGADYNKGAPLNASEFDQNTVNLRAAVDSKANLISPSFTTPALGVATGTSFNLITGLASVAPVAPAVAAVVGTSTLAARQDHKHPTNFTATATDIKMNGTQAVGALVTFSRADHVHPSDTTRMPLAGTAGAVSFGAVTAKTYNPIYIEQSVGGGFSRALNITTRTDVGMVGLQINTIDAYTSGSDPSTGTVIPLIGINAAVCEVLINKTTSDGSGAKLQVAGGISATQTIGTTGDLKADYTVYIGNLASNPTAVSGYGRLYVDSSTGYLMCKFPNGTNKLITTNI